MVCWHLLHNHKYSPRFTILSTLVVFVFNQYSPLLLNSHLRSRRFDTRLGKATYDLGMSVDVYKQKLLYTAVSLSTKHLQNCSECKMYGKTGHLRECIYIEILRNIITSDSRYTTTCIHVTSSRATTCGENIWFDVCRLSINE